MSMEPVSYPHLDVYKRQDVDLLWDIQSKIEGKTICPLGEAAAWPVAAAIRHFKQEFIDIAKSKKFVDISHYDRLNKLARI